jgi:hypothetical protein
MKCTRAFPLILVMAALTACQAETDETMPEDTPPATEPAAAPAAPPAALMSSDIQPEGGSSVAGRVEILPSADAANAFRVSVNLQGVPQGDHAWHIHQGACGAKDTPVVVPFTEDKDKPAIDSPITAGADGAVTRDVSVPANLLTIDQLRSGDYSLHVHQKAGTDHGPSIACATL